jgi:opine dehydrogenase
LSPARNIIQRGLTDFGAVAHASIALANMNLISRKTPFRFYYEGMTEETIRLLESVESEFRAIAAAYGSDLIAMKDLLDRYYTCDTTNLYTAMTTVPNYRYSLGPETLQHRFLHEYICSTLVPAVQLAELANIKAPIVEALINIAGAVTQRNLKSEGRSLESLGLKGMSYQQVFDYVNG